MNRGVDRRDFLECIQDLLGNPDLVRLQCLPSHRFRSHVSKQGTGRLSHCLRVAYLSHRLAGLFRASKKDSARAGLLHDYGYLACSRSPGHAVLTHHIVGAAIIKRMGYENLGSAIESHMFPIGMPPLSRVAMTIWLADKIDSVLDLLHLNGSLDRQLCLTESTSE
jgi:putative nucleotidyltransferase with HDIG domain